MTKTHKNKSYDKIIQSNRAVMGLQRKRHFESAGDLASWRGRADVYVDRKKEKTKSACRGKVKWN